MTRQSIDRLAQSGVKHLRVTLDWAAIEPREGVFSAAQTLVYRDTLTYMREKGIEPVLALHDGKSPDWFEGMGGFARPANLPFFVAYIEYAVTHLGKWVKEYITFNRLNAGLLKPGLSSLRRAVNVQSVLVSCHMEAYTCIHEAREGMGFDDTRAGFVHRGWEFFPKDKERLAHKLSAGLAAYLLHNAPTRAMLSGWFDFPLKNFTQGLSAGVYADFVGLEEAVSENIFDNQLTWRVKAQGINDCVKALRDIMPVDVYYIDDQQVVKKEPFL
jgi:beta-glucosidase